MPEADEECFRCLGTEKKALHDFGRESVDMRKAKVRDFMRRNVKCILETKSVKEAARLMKRYNIGGLIVVDRRGKVKGIVTKTDIVYKYVAGKKRRLRDVMTKRLIKIDPGATLEEAAELMARHHIEKLPVFEGRKLVGIISASDILRIEPGLHTVLYELLKLKGAPLEEEETTSGLCERCGNYSEDLREVNGLWLCENCREEE